MKQANQNIKTFGKKNGRIQVVVQTIEEDTIKKFAEKAHLSISAYVRLCIFEKINREEDSQ